MAPDTAACDCNPAGPGPDNAWGDGPPYYDEDCPVHGRPEIIGQPATAACVRRAGPALAVQCRKDNEAEVNAFLREVRGLYPGRHYRPNPHGAWQGIYDSHGMVEQVWVGSWLVSLPESRPYANLSDSLFRELYEAPDGT